MLTHRDEVVGGLVLGPLLRRHQEHIALLQNVYMGKMRKESKRVSKRGEGECMAYNITWHEGSMLP